MHFEVMLVDADGTTTRFFTGDLAPAEVGPILVAALKRIQTHPPGGLIAVRHAPDPKES